jgi:hypothetical protein
MEVLTNKDANKLLKKVLDFDKMLIVYLGHDISIDFDDIVEQTK